MNRKREPQGEAERLICEYAEADRALEALKNDTAGDTVHRTRAAAIRAEESLVAFYDREFKPSREWVDGGADRVAVTLRRRDGSEEKQVSIPTGVFNNVSFAAGACAALNALEAAKDE